MSGTWSPLRPPTTIGLPVGQPAGAKVPVGRPIASTSPLSATLLAMMSATPSASTSPAFSDFADVPAAYATGGKNVPSPPARVRFEKAV